ncbi:hypothetical protein ABPG74_015106 [Tetrahymena malaccensis]
MDQSKEFPINVAYMHGSDRGHNCGYCKNKTGSFTYGFDTTQMKAEVYKSLMDCGWRRCGSYFYKPDLFKSCCKSYTIRMNANQFQIKKSQKKVMKKWNKFIYSKDSKSSDNKMQEEIKSKSKGQENDNKMNKSCEKIQKIVNYSVQNEQQVELREQMISLAQGCEVSKSLIIKELNNPQIQIAQVSFIKKEILDVFKILPSKCPKKGIYFTNYFMLFFAKNKEALQGTKPNFFIESCQEVLKPLFERFIKDFLYEIDLNGQVNFFERNPSQEKNQDKTQQQAEEKNQNSIEKSEEKLEADSKGDQQNATNSNNKMQPESQAENKMEIENKSLNTSFSKGIAVKAIEFIKKGKQNNKNEESFKEDKDKKEQEEGEDGFDKFHWDTDKFTSTEIKKGRLTIKVQLAKCDQQNFSMYQKYCNEIHEKAKESIDGFKGFLCEKTISFNMKTSEISKDQKLMMGCFHMNYFLDNEFIAVGVVDLFEDNLSSVYFYYDPKYQNYSLGVVGAIYEIEYIQQMSKFFPKFQYYYLGFYIQDCQKMVYKGDYGPAELLCPRTYKWYPLDEKTRKFIESKPKDPSLAPPQDQIDAKMSHTTNIKTLQKFVEEKTRTALQGQIIPSKQFFSFFNQALKNTFFAIASVIDQNLYPTLLFDFTQK